MKCGRLIWAILFFLFLGIEVFIALNIHDTFIRPYLGDVLVIWVLYFGIRTVLPKPVPHLPALLFLLGCGAEFLQYFHAADFPVIRQIPAIRIILGSTFDVRDMACYGVGAVSIWLFSSRKASSASK